jgi:hypothetical protein
MRVADGAVDDSRAAVMLRVAKPALNQLLQQLLLGYAAVAQAPLELLKLLLQLLLLPLEAAEGCLPTAALGQLLLLPAAHGKKAEPQ